MAGPRDFEEARPLVAEAKKQLWKRFSSDRNVVGMGFGAPTRGGQRLDVPACIVHVVRKVPAEQLAKDRIVPRAVEVRGVQVETDVKETGRYYARSYTARERPAIGGISIGHGQTTAGTLGCLVHDRRNNNQLSILSNNHVLAVENMATVGDPIYQPGPYDATAVPDNVIGSLTRYVSLIFGGTVANFVDAAICDISNNCIVYDDIKGKMTRPTDAQPAVGLLFAGSAVDTVYNPINEVAVRLGIEMPFGPAARSAVTAADVTAPGAAVQKTGRSTEYTTGRILEIDADFEVTYDRGPVLYEDQIVTTLMDQGGDSGSVLCRGGTGGTVIIFPFCPFLVVAQELTGVPFTQESLSIQYARDKYLANSLVGRWLIDTLYLNEPTAMRRATDVRPQVPGDDRAFAQALYSEHGGEMKLALMNPDRDDIRVSEQFLQDAEESLARARKYMLPEEADAVRDTIALVRQRGIVGKNGRELITMLDDAELLQKLKEIAARSGSVKDPDD